MLREERSRVFLEACRQFLSALLLRMDELAEPGRTRDDAEIDELRKLLSSVSFLVRTEVIEKPAQEEQGG
jgi:hypothetical protein